MGIIDYAKSHPLMIAGGVFAAGVVWLLMSQGSGGGDSNGLSAFYAAQAAQKTSGDQVAIAQIQAQAQTSTGLAYLDTQKSINQIWSSTQLAQSHEANQTAITLAPFKVQDDYLAAVTSIASMPPTIQTSTTTKKSGGFFGIGGGSKTSTSQIVVPNPGWDLLGAFAGLFTAPPPTG